MLANDKTYTASLRLVGLVFLFPLALFASAGTTAQSQTPPFKITAMKAMLFYDNNGTFSADVAGEDDGEPFVPSILWNTPMEGSSRVGASSSTLVTVEVTGETEAAPLRKIEFIARYIPLNRSRREIIVTKTASIRMGESDKFVAGFWLNETGCNPVKLSARIVGQRRTARIKKIIKFGCGE